MSEERMEDLLGTVRDVYNVPPQTPVDAIWAEIEPRLTERDPKLIDLAQARHAHAPGQRRPLTWAAAAAAVLVLGIGIGRVTSPSPVRPGAEARVSEAPTGLSFVAAEHLGRSESLLTMVRADARQGRLDPAVASWARSLLTQTRLMLDRDDQASPVLEELLEDLELVLVQIVSVAEGGEVSSERGRTELELAVRGLEEREVLSRIRAVVPVGGGSLSGT